MDWLSTGLPQSPQTLSEVLVLLFALVIGHALADYPLQGDYLGTHKNRHAPAAPGAPRTLWLHCMTAHCLIHAGMVWLITGRVVFALAEFILHFLLDTMKCEGKTNLDTDQFLHVVCKIAYTVILWQLL